MPVMQTLFFPRRLMSLINVSWLSDKSYLDNLSLNSSMGRLMISSTLMGIFRFLALFSSLVNCSSSLLLLLFSLLRGVLDVSAGNAYVWLRDTWFSGVITREQPLKPNNNWKPLILLKAIKHFRYSATIFHYSLQYIPAMCLVNCEEPGIGIPSLTDMSYGKFIESGIRPTWLFDLGVSVTLGVPKIIRQKLLFY